MASQAHHGAAPCRRHAHSGAREHEWAGTHGTCAKDKVQHEFSEKLELELQDWTVWPPSGFSWLDFRRHLDPGLFDGATWQSTMHNTRSVKDTIKSSGLPIGRPFPRPRVATAVSHVLVGSFASRMLNPESGGQTSFRCSLAGKPRRELLVSADWLYSKAKRISRVPNKHLSARNRDRQSCRLIIGLFEYWTICRPPSIDDIFNAFRGFSLSCD